jgi:four helix bundle protein
MGAARFEDLEVWQKAHRWVLQVYRLTRGFPKEELFVLTAQLRRAAISVPSNICEGFRKRSKTDKIYSYDRAQHSLEEARYQLMLAGDLSYANCGPVLALLDEVARMLDAYVRAIMGRG